MLFSEASPQRAFEVPDRFADVESTAITNALVEDILNYLMTFKGERYDLIFRLLYETYSTREIANELGLPWSTTKDAIKRMRKLVQDYVKISHSPL